MKISLHEQDIEIGNIPEYVRSVQNTFVSMNICCVTTGHSKSGLKFDILQEKLNYI